MAELLIVVAIITILGGVGVVAVGKYQESLARKEANTIAKEIFFAAQNHLTMAESQGYLKDNIDYGEDAKVAVGDEVKALYYFAVDSSNASGAFAGNSVLDLMLPFGSIDETIRSGGNYVIYYQADPARVLHVWYGRAKNEAYTGKYSANPADLINTATGINGLLTGYEGASAVIGHYGGDEAQESGVTLNAPSITVDNAERLTVTIETTNVNKDELGNPILPSGKQLTVKLLITGETSQAMAAIPVLDQVNTTKTTMNHRVADSSTDSAELCSVVLDDITNTFGSAITALEYGTKYGYHFAEITDGAGLAGKQITVVGAFIPGENIIVQAVAYSPDALASIAYSNEVTTNSLFADVVDAADASVTGVTTGKVALISNFRHLENLDKRVSGVNTAQATGSNAYVIAGAKQMADLVWIQTGTAEENAPVPFTTAIQNPSVYQIGATAGTEAGCYLPVKLDYALVYDGASLVDGVMKCHSITGVKVGSSETPFAGAAGLFGEVAGQSGIQVDIRNLELIDFSITATGNAGALAGTIGTEQAAASVTNVLARNTLAFDAAKAQTATVTSSGGNAGGLIGSMTGVTVQKCAAALIVSGGANAGGLIGDSHGTSAVISSYSGGHTTAKKDAGGAVIGTEYGKTVYNVTAPKTSADKGNAGGLIGDAGVTDITYCYSTCSVSGKTAGGLIGYGGKAVASCYATGLVDGTTKGAFAGYLNGANVSDSWYFEIINEQTDATTGVISYLEPVPGKVASDEAVIPEGKVKQTGVARLDYSAESYDAFVGARQSDNKYLWKTAVAYDPTLGTYYNGKDADNNAVTLFNLRTVDQLPSSTTKGAERSLKTGDDDAEDYFVTTHYGDWPAPEVFVINTPTGSNGGL